MTQRYRLEFHPTNPPRPMALWDSQDGMPGNGAVLVATFGELSTMEDAQAICDEMNKGIEE